ncbi:unnamed protein product [Trichogramma brassicae]|uniref:Uncharacterized protein n=1 Tax=Trichogramma brassicae TaxID=86971 RepID=A0A6H5IZP8_9HYME|nr:unnamed protein product [Trichogramma brassicae]
MITAVPEDFSPGTVFGWLRGPVEWLLAPSWLARSVGLPSTKIVVVELSFPPWSPLQRWTGWLAHCSLTARPARPRAPTHTHPSDRGLSDHPRGNTQTPAARLRAYNIMDPPRNCSGLLREVLYPRQEVELENLLNELKVGRADEERTTQILERLGNLTSESTWKGPLPNLRDTFQQEEVDRILMNVVDHISRNQNDSIKGFVIIDFIAHTGYRHEPEVNEDGKILLHLTTPLHVAAKYEYNEEMNFSIAPLLFEIYRDDLNYTDESGVTHFHVACMYRCGIQIVRKFLEFGQDPNLLVESTGDTPLHYALEWGYYIAVSLMLLKNGADPNVPNKLGRTPLQLAVSNLRMDQFDLLWNHGVNLSNFVFPTFSRFETTIDNKIGKLFNSYLKLTRITFPIMKIVGCLEKKGYELDRSDALTIMKLFSKYELFEKSTDAEKLLRNDEEFATSSKNKMMKRDLSLYDLLQLRPEEAAKLFTYEDHDAWNWSNLYELYSKRRDTCAIHLCEKLSRRFFLDWAIDPFIELIHGRLPILCFEHFHYPAAQLYPLHQVFHLKDDLGPRCRVLRVDEF